MVKLSLILGIAALFCGAIPGLGLILALIGLICSLICKKKIKQGQIDDTGAQTLLSNIGLITSILGLITGIIITIMLVFGFAFFNNAKKMQSDMLDDFITRQQELIDEAKKKQQEILNNR